MRMKGGVAASRGATCACCPFMRADAVRGMSIGKNQWPRDWITRQDRWKDMDRCAQMVDRSKHTETHTRAHAYTRAYAHTTITPSVFTSASCSLASCARTLTVGMCAL